MKNPLCFIAIVLFCISLSIDAASSSEKLRFATMGQINPAYALGAMAAQEKGIWTRNGLEAEWVALAGAGPLHRVLAAGVADLGLVDALSTIQAVSRGVPGIMIADLGLRSDFSIWVRSDSPIRLPQELKGAKIGVVRLGGPAHLYAQILARSLGLEGKIMFVAGGGFREEVAMLKAGRLDGRSASYITAALLKATGELREIASVGDYLPPDWTELVLVGHRRFVQERPGVAKKGIKAYLEAVEFIIANPEWAIAKTVSPLGYPQEAAKDVFARLAKMRTDGRINRRALENLRAFLIESGLIPRDKAPKLEELYSSRFTE